MDNFISIYNNMLNFNLRQSVNSVNDLLYNIQSLKQLQLKLDAVQEFKNETLMMLNLASLGYLRKYILDVPNVGVLLFRNLIKCFYPLNDKQIVRYQNNLLDGQYIITNTNVLKSKGAAFTLNNRNYTVVAHRSEASVWQSVLLSELDDISKFDTSDIYRYNYKIDFHNDERICEYNSSGAQYRNALMENVFISWDWELVKDIAKKAYEYPRYDHGIKDLLWNKGFIAQMGVDNIEATILKLQDISGGKLYKGSMEAALEEYNTMSKYLLYSYLPITKEFIITHQDELDWQILQRNPRIEWDWELLNLFLRKYKSTICESDWCLSGSASMYSFIEPFLNNELLSDIEKLYDL